MDYIDLIIVFTLVDPSEIMNGDILQNSEKSNICKKSSNTWSMNRERPKTNWMQNILLYDVTYI